MGVCLYCYYCAVHEPADDWRDIIREMSARKPGLSVDSDNQKNENKENHVR